MTTAQATPKVTATTVREWISDSDNIKILDVRTPAEFESAHIPGAFNVPLDQVDQYSDRLQAGANGSTVVMVCQSGQRAEQARARLAAKGMDTQCLDGGMNAWERAQGQVEQGRQRWDLERQVRLVAGSLVLSGILGSTVYAPLKYLSAAVGGGLAFAALSNTCAMGKVLSKLPYNQDSDTDVDEVVAAFETS